MKPLVIGTEVVADLSGLGDRQRRRLCGSTRASGPMAYIDHGILPRTYGPTKQPRARLLLLSGTRP
jgi:hypothetical protein